ncbi:MAG: right-handed parallel beta-helix repeat-containing protein [Candidatus Hodarchaeota archaeon]
MIEHEIIFLNGSSQIDTFFYGNGSDGTTWDTAYKIKNLEMNKLTSESGIEIWNTNRHIIIENCEIRNTGVPWLIKQDKTSLVDNPTWSISLNNFTIYPWEGPAAIKIVNSSNIKIRNCIIKSNIGDGILSIRDNNINIENNIIENNVGRGIRINSSNSIFLRNNSIKNHDIGISLYNSNDLNISYNLLTSNLDSIRFEYTKDSLIFSNNITNNIQGIVLLKDSGMNRIISNLFLHNNWTQVISFQNFSNIWSNGQMGNYWSDYTFQYPNASNDGEVWNLPYIINGSPGDVDSFPLFNQPNVSYTSEENDTIPISKVGLITLIGICIPFPGVLLYSFLILKSKKIHVIFPRNQ